MPPAIATAPTPSPPAQPDRPSWLPADQPLPGAPAAVAPPPVEQYVPSYPEPAPLWVAPAPASNGSRTMVMAAAAVILVLLVGIGGYSIFEASRANNTSLNNSAQLSSPSPIASATVSSQPAAALPLTANLQGEYCPVSRLNSNACWHGSLENTGPPIGKLALMFVTGGGYTNWFSTHSSPALSGFYTTAGCELDAAHGQMVCGSVSAGGSIEVYLSGDTSQRGTFHYAVKFADISSGTPVYIDQNPDGTHQVVSWYETIG
jgi:hypothetical protein